MSFARSGFALLLFVLLTFACSAEGGGGAGDSCTSSADCEEGFTCRDEVCVAETDGGGFPDGGPGMDAGGPECLTDVDCDGFVCVDGACCAPDDVCGSSCCGGGETCFANACVVPGGPCRSAEDCADGQYCEPGLGGGGSMDGGVPADAGGATCLGDAPNPGRCVDLPPPCMGDPMPGEVCTRACEYRPPVGMLDAVEQWRWGEAAETFAGQVDVWATPAVARITDTNCDGVVDEFDPPNIIFVSSNAGGSCCQCGGAPANACKTGVLRVLDGPTGQEIWSSRRPSDGSLGFAAMSVAVGDVDHDGDMEIVGISGEGYVVLVDHEGNTVAQSDVPITGFAGNNATGWGGGLSIGDMDHDGDPEIAYGRAVFTTDGATITRVFEGTGTWGRVINQAIGYFADIVGDDDLELVVGDSAYDASGALLWDSPLANGFSAVGNFDDDPEPEIAFVADGVIHLLSAADGSEEVDAIVAPGADPGRGGPPTIADFDGDGRPEIGVAFKNNYQVVRANYGTGALEQVWATPNHDFSSSVTGSTVFDFEGDGAAEVIYNDECFLWVYDGATGAVRFATPTTSFTATEASLVADVDSDGSAEIVMVANRADPSTTSGWDCDGVFNGTDWRVPAAMGDADFGRPGWVGSDGASAPYSGITVFRARDNSWVGTRSLWNQHAYSVSNVCGDRGDPCTPASTYGDIPVNQVANWSVGFLNNFRQNIQGEGVFDAPDATVTLTAVCSAPPELVAAVRNLGAAVLPAGVEVGFYAIEADGSETELGRGTTATSLFPGQAAEVRLTASGRAQDDTFLARILVDPAMPTFRECREDNNESERVQPRCIE